MNDHEFALISIFDDYAYRGKGLKDYCLYDYYSMFYKYNRQSEISFTHQHSQQKSYRQFLRIQPAISALLEKIFTSKPNLVDDKAMKNYFCIFSELFVS